MEVLAEGTCTSLPNAKQGQLMGWLCLVGRKWVWGITIDPHFQSDL